MFLNKSFNFFCSENETYKLDIVKIFNIQTKKRKEEVEINKSKKKKKKEKTTIASSSYLLAIRDILWEIQLLGFFIYKATVSWKIAAK